MSVEGRKRLTQVLSLQVYSKSYYDVLLNLEVSQDMR